MRKWYTWRTHNENVLNDAKEWQKENILYANPREGEAIQIDSTVIDKAIKGIEIEKYLSSLTITAEILKISGGDCHPYR